MARSSGLLCRREEALLMVVDIQERLAAAMEDDVRQEVFHNAGLLAEAAGKLSIPCFLTEQYPKGLGPTASAVRQHLASEAVSFEKTCFSCLGADGLPDRLRESGRRQVVIAGMEAHVCVLQTALDLHSAGWEVFVAEDAVCSRAPRNRRNAMDRLRQAGVVVANTESILFEWLRDARHEQFKAISALLR
ncbi:MAG: hydrolase [bacterium]|nr:hydrolase [bacterium]